MILNMLDIKIKNFGPIAEGDISLKPLTILIGPNNTGKSYAAILVYCLHSAFNKMSDRFRWPSIYKRKIRGSIYLGEENTLQSFFIEENQVKQIRSWVNKIKNIVEKDGKFDADIPNNITLNLYKNILNIFTELLNEELSFAFASNLKEMVRLDTNSFSFKIDIGEFKICFEFIDNKLVLKELSNKELDKLIISLKIRDDKKEYAFKSGKVSLNHYKIYIHSQIFKGIPSQILIHEIQEYIAESIFEEFMNHITKVCHYLPAARSGIIQAHRAVSAAIISEAPLAALRKMDIPTLSGITARFMISLIELTPMRIPRLGRNTQLEKIIRIIEKDIIKGAISVKTIKHLYPEFTYDLKGLSIPLHRTSSMVSEMAPIVLYLRYLVDKDDLLIIEEPEAHLHPEMQRILARVIVQLIRNDVKVLITTHSDYLIEQISNFIKMNEIKDKDRELMGYTADDFLRPDEVSSHLFKYGYKIGTVTERLDVGKEGIPQEEFGKIAESLYEEKVKLQRKIME